MGVRPESDHFTLSLDTLLFELDAGLRARDERGITPLP